MKDYLLAEPSAVRRKDREVEDERWIRDMLRHAPYGVLATSNGGRPFVNSNLFAFCDEENAIYMHTARMGRTAANVSAEQQVCFSVFEMGRLLPAPRAFNMSVEYSGVVVFGRARVLATDEEKSRALQLLLHKYFAHLRPEDDYATASPEELFLTAVYRIAIDAWSGKQKVVDHAFQGAFWYKR